MVFMNHDGVENGRHAVKVSLHIVVVSCLEAGAPKQELRSERKAHHSLSQQRQLQSNK